MKSKKKDIEKLRSDFYKLLNDKNIMGLDKLLKNDALKFHLFYQKGGKFSYI